MAYGFNRRMYNGAHKSQHRINRMYPPLSLSMCMSMCLSMSMPMCMSVCMCKAAHKPHNTAVGRSSSTHDL